VTDDSDRVRGALPGRAASQFKRDEREFSDSLTARVLNFLDDERRLTARYLHDATQQNLLAIRMNLEQALARQPDDARLRALLSESILVAEQTIAQVRTISYSLHPPILDQAGLGPALRWYAKAASWRGGIEVHLEIPEEMSRKPAEIETAIFRIAQEAIGDARHSPGAQVTVRVTDMQTSITVEVEDRSSEVLRYSDRRKNLNESATTLGLAGIEERVKALHGTFAFFTEVGQGHMLRVTLPVDARAAEKEIAAAAAAGKKK
jgi:two-component system, NarL family, sensor kinase